MLGFLPVSDVLYESNRASELLCACLCEMALGTGTDMDMCCDLRTVVLLVVV